MPTKKGNTKSRKNTNAYKKLLFSDGGGQEVEVHTSLPPCVQGESRGCLKVLVRAVKWEYSIGPPAPKLCLRLKWWGEQSRGTIFRVPVCTSSNEQLASCSHFAYFPVRTSMQQLKTYLKDMGPLSIDVGLGHLSDSSMVIGQVAIPALTHLSASTPVEGQYPVVSPQGIEFGKIMMRFSLDEEKALSRQQGKTSVRSDPVSELQVGLENDALPRSTLSKMARQPVDLNCAAQHGFNATKSIAAAPAKSGNTTQGQTTGTSQGQTSGTTSGVQLSSANVPSVVDGVTLPELPGKARGDVIADLIQRGRKLRESMLQAIVQSSLVCSGPVDCSPRLVDDRELELGSCTFLDQHPAVPGKLSGVPTDDIVALLVGSGVGLSSDHRATNSNSSDDDLDSVGSSLTEADHPLYNADLLRTLFYTDELKGTEQADVAAGLATAGGGKIQPPSDPLAPPGEATQATKIVGGATGGQAKMLGRDGTQSNGSSAIGADSISSLASFFSGGQRAAEPVESVVLRSVGMERLTRLGRATSVRVIVEKLQLTPIGIEIVRSCQKGKKLSKALSTTYFVEYHFPLTLSANKSTNKKSTCPPRAGELVRMASRQIRDGVVVLSHCSVFPVTFSSHVVQQWWSSLMVLRVYSKASEERMPFLLGKAMLPLKQCLTAAQLKSSFVLDVKASPLGAAVKGQEPFTSKEESIIGSLEVSFQFIIGKQQEEVLPPVSPGEGEEGLPPMSSGEVGLPPVSSGVAGLPPILSGEAGTPIEHVSQEVVEQRRPVVFGGLPTDKPPAVLQLMLFISEGVDVSIPGSSPSSAKPNPYLVCKLFCVHPHPRTTVHWSTSNPLFGFKEVYPLHLTSSLLEKLCNKFAVVEVWHKTPGATMEDELIGLVKLSVHQFYVAFADQLSVDLCLSAELPVVAVDMYSPITNPFSGANCGYLATLLAMGNTSQLLQLQRQLAAGTYVLQPPHSKSRMEHAILVEDSRCQKGQRADEFQTKPPPARKTADMVHNPSHTIEICVGGVRQLSAFSNTVWGEADCYVQYHFPSLSDDEEGDLEEGTPPCALQAYCTGTSLCVPEPTFNHTTKHTLTLSADVPLQKLLIKACGSTCGGGIPFELWRRFYYPNIRDQLIAKTSLPLAKLCAMVTMQRSPPNSQSFALPLKLVIDDPEATSGGILDVSVRYQCTAEPAEVLEHQARVTVNLSLGILRCTGLKDAAKQSALLAPGLLSSAATEAGVNAYVKVRFPGSVVQEEKRTKTVALSFTPEFSHFFDICLPLVVQVDTKSHPVRVRKVSLAEVLSSGTMCVEVWHELTRRLSRGTQPDDKCFGRMLVTGSKDVLLGHAEVPLATLLHRHNGACGWSALYRKDGDGFVGGVEVALSFTREEDRELVISSAAHLSWKPPPTTLDLCASPSATQQQKLRFEVTIDGVWVSVDDVIIPTTREPSYKYCFVRYRLFSLDPVVSTPRAVTSYREDIAVYQLNHSSKLTTMPSTQLLWYLREEPLEVQVWTSVQSRMEVPHPQASDKLLGCAYVTLADLAFQDTHSVSGNFPLFKSGVDSLNNQHLHLTVKRTVVDELKEDTSVIEIMDTPDERPPSAPPPHATSEQAHQEAGMPQCSMDTFEAHLAVCEALHLQDVDSRERNGDPRSVYVTVQPHPNTDSIVTPLVHNNSKPVWDYQCVAKIPNYYLDSVCSGLEFQVWSTHQKVEEWTGEEDSYLGSARVDLSALYYGLGQLCGWYHILDFGQQIRGQLKVSISPANRIQYSSSHQATSEYRGMELLSHIAHMSETHPPDSRTTSVLFKELRKHIDELDKVIQARLEERDQVDIVNSHTANCVSPIPPPSNQPVSAVHTKHSAGVESLHSASILDNHLTETHTLKGSEGQTLASNPLEGIKYISHPTKDQTHVSCPSKSQILVSEGQAHVSHALEGRAATGTVSSSESPPNHIETHVSGSPDVHTDQIETHVSGSPGVHTGLSMEYCSSSLSPEQCTAIGQETTSCCSTPIRSQSSTSLTSVTGSSNDGTLDKEDGSEGEQTDRCQFDKVQVHTDVPLIAENKGNLDGVMEHPHNGASTTSHHTIAADNDTRVSCTTSFVTPPQKEDSLATPPPKRVDCKGFPTVDLPDFFMQPHKLEQTMRSLRAAALSRPPPRKLLVESEGKPSRIFERPDQPKWTKAGPQTIDAHELLSPAEMQRIARVFSSKPQGPPT